MEQYVIKGGNPLNGEVEIGGAKNAALAILAAAIMTDETVTIENLPNVRDINVLLQAIEVPLYRMSVWITNLSAESAHLIIFWGRFLASTRRRKLRCREAVTSEAVR